MRIGFRVLDCADSYGNERELGVALKQFLSENPHLKREDFYITTKINHAKVSDIAVELKTALNRLGLTYIDLYLLHSPFFKEPISQVWSQMESLVELGLTKKIGVSNYRIRDLKELLPIAKIKPAVNQIEYHPYLQQPELVNYCQSNGIVVHSYSSLAPLHLKTDGPVNAVVERLSKKYGKSQELIILKWVLQKGIVVVTTTSKEERMKDLMSLIAPDWVLSKEDCQEIDEVGQTVNFRKYWTQYSFE